jgi:beta-N-acetylhexosaminidase
MKHLISPTKRIFLGLILILVFLSGAKNRIEKDRAIFDFEEEDPHTKFRINQKAWADSILNLMTIDEKIGQLFMIAAFSNRSEAEYRKLETQIQQYHLGGIIFFQGSPIKQALLTNRYQQLSKIPLMIGIDGEWGLGMRLDDLESYPKAITLGATHNAQVVEKVGYGIGLQCKRMGIHINFAPDADINSNPKNPVINFRSFGGSPTEVASLSKAYSRGMKKAGIMGSAKHFPGHGDTDVDSHKSLPVLNHTKKHLEEIETVPFKNLIADSIASVMVGHLHVPALDPAVNSPATVSSKIIKEFLVDQLKFEGLIITDALNMRGLLKYYPTGEAEVRAFKAGNDILLQTANLEVAFNAIRSKILDSTLSVSDLDKKVKKILMSKYWAGLNNYKPIDIQNLIKDLNSSYLSQTKQEVFEKAITVVKDDPGVLPFRNLNNVTYSSLAISAKQDNYFQQYFNQFVFSKNITLPFKPAKSSDWTWVAEEVSKSDVVVVSLHELHNLENKNYGIVPETINLIRAIAKNTTVVVCVFGNPYSLKFFDEFETVICGYEDDALAHLAVNNVLFGVKPSFGKIPVNTLSPIAKLKDGINTLTLGRLGYGNPKDLGFDADKLDKISDIVNSSINAGEFPGAQVLVAKHGSVVFHKSFGSLRYGYQEPVNNQTVFDLASLTKVSATLQAVMMLHSQKKIDLNKALADYIPELKNTDKSNLILKDVLLHQAGLKSFIPFWENTKTPNGTLDENFYKNEQVGNYIKVAENLYIKPSIKDSVIKWIGKSPLISSKGTKKYVYSDLGMILMERVVENIVKKPLDVFLEENLFNPLGLKNTYFNIYKRFSLDNIAPTEVDNTFRKQTIKGTVHDQNAALMGGVSGHAGLFSNAWDLAILFQMNLQKGVYLENNFFDEETFDIFTAKQSTLSHRGLGWNKPSKEDGSVSDLASSLTFGHTGFTGTAVWVDPENHLIYIFLSNRVYPTSENNKILKNKTRKRIHDAIYEAMLKKSEDM